MKNSFKSCRRKKNVYLLLARVDPDQCASKPINVSNCGTLTLFRSNNRSRESVVIGAVRGVLRADASLINIIRCNTRTTDPH